MLFCYFGQPYTEWVAGKGITIYFFPCWSTLPGLSAWGVGWSSRPPCWCCVCTPRSPRPCEVASACGHPALARCAFFYMSLEDVERLGRRGETAERICLKFVLHFFLGMEQHRRPCQPSFSSDLQLYIHVHIHNTYTAACIHVPASHIGWQLLICHCLVAQRYTYILAFVERCI